MSVSYNLDVRRRGGDFLYITSRDLPGFRVLSKAIALEDSITSSFRAFYPLWLLAKGLTPQPTRIVLESREDAGSACNFRTEIAF